MTATAHQGPLVVFSGAATGSNPNPDAGPTTCVHGYLVGDSRVPWTYQPGGLDATASSSNNPHFYGWASMHCEVINQVPIALSTTNIAATQSSSAASAAGSITLATVTSTSSAGVNPVGSFKVATTGVAMSSAVLALDGTTGYISYGSTGAVVAWDPSTLVSRNIRVTTSSPSSDTGSVTVNGYDVYGWPMTELISVSTSSAGGTASGAKAFKYISSVTISSVLNSTAISVGTGDVIGIPLYTSNWAYTSINYPSSAALTTSTGYTAGVTTTATSSTGDVRGTYALVSASDSVKRLVIFVSPPASTLTSSSTPITGVTQA